MISFFTGLLIGATQIGAGTWRTMSVISGNLVKVMTANIIVSIGFWFSIQFVIQRDLPGYIGFSLGAGILTLLLTYKNRIKLEEISSTS